jgi:hypothetical protein
MADIPKVGGGPDDGPRDIDLRLSLREAVLVHRALRDKEATLRKEAWWLNEQADQDGAEVLKREAQGYADTARRIALILDRLMGVEQRGPNRV